MHRKKSNRRFADIPSVKLLEFDVSQTRIVCLGLYWYNIRLKNNNSLFKLSVVEQNR